MTICKIKYRIVDKNGQCLSFALTKREAVRELARVNTMLPNMNKNSAFYFPAIVPFRIITEKEWRARLDEALKNAG